MAPRISDGFFRMNTSVTGFMGWRDSFTPSGFHYSLITCGGSGVFSVFALHFDRPIVGS